MAAATSCHAEAAFGLGSFSSELVNPHLRSSQNWFRKIRLQMNFMSIHCDNFDMSSSLHPVWPVLCVP